MNQSDSPEVVRSSDQLGACHDDGCICRGNWRALVKEYEARIGRQYIDDRGKRWTFFGLVWADDDLYYGMSRKGKQQLLSCVGGIESYGFRPADTDMIPVHAMRAIAVEAIREGTGCPDIKCIGGESLVDKIERLALVAARGA